jgi:hypothetical protein
MRFVSEGDAKYQRDIHSEDHILHNHGGENIN